jgi:hypothetical protein
LFEDEFSLSNTATVHYQWGKKGKQPTISCKQRQRERQTAMGSYNFDTGQMTHFQQPNDELLRVCEINY